MKSKKEKDIILGAGITGLTASYSTGFPIYEAENYPGGICASYYIKAFSKKRLVRRYRSSEMYRFEIGGGHWIFGMDDIVSQFVNKFSRTKNYSRDAAVYFSKKKLYVPYPIQNNLRFLDENTRKKTLKELSDKSDRVPGTMYEWLKKNFGNTLCKLFFLPFHDLYTAGLYRKISPQDLSKSPVNYRNILKGAKKKCSPVGYNTNFAYPNNGLNHLINKIAATCEIHYGKKVINIDVKKREIYFKDKSIISYNNIISTIPLNKMIKFTGIQLKSKPDPYTSVVVLNIGATKGKTCPDEHWLYVPDSKSNFYRIGFYSNVDASFLPRSLRKSNKNVSIYVERAYRQKKKPAKTQIKHYSNSVIKELRAMGFIEKVEVLDYTWIDVAYTWTIGGSRWREEAIEALEEHDIYQIGRYGRWHFQGIADSIREGLNFRKQSYIS